MDISKEDVIDESSSSKTQPTGSEAEKTPEEKPSHPETVPYARLKEVIDEKNGWKESVKTLEEKINGLYEKLTPKQEEEKSNDPEFKSPSELADWVAERTSQKLEAKSSAAAREAAEEEAKLEAEMITLRNDGAKFDESELANFMLEYEIEDVKKAYNLFSKIQSSSTASEQEEMKRNLKDVPVNKGSRSADGETGNLSYETISNLSFDTLAKASRKKASR